MIENTSDSRRAGDAFSTVMITAGSPVEQSAPFLGTRDGPISEKIRGRLQKANRRFHANDNIAAFIEPGEMDGLLDEVSAQVALVLKSLVIDTVNDHNTRGTARRIAKMYLTEVFHGRYSPLPPVTEFPNVARLNELMIVGPITVRSACSQDDCQTRA